MEYITGKIIKELREKQQLTQKELADRINVSDKTIPENGKQKKDFQIYQSSKTWQKPWVLP